MILRVCIVCERVGKASVIRVWVHAFLEFVQLIHDMVPDLKRVSSGSSKHTSDWQEVLVSTGHFKDVIFVEANHEIAMSKGRYLQAWRSVNDIQAQAGQELFDVILESIEGKIDHLDKVVVPYKTRAWTARAQC